MLLFVLVAVVLFCYFMQDVHCPEDWHGIY